MSRVTEELIKITYITLISNNLMIIVRLLL
jgi:hypothetical protein